MVFRFYTKFLAVNTTTPHDQWGPHTAFFLFKMYTSNTGSGNVPSFETVFEKIEKRFLHHVGHFVTLQRRANEHDRSHGRHDVVRWRGLLFFEEDFPFVFCCRRG